MNPVILLFLFFSVMLWAFLFHEAGHFLYFKKMLKRNDIKIYYKWGRVRVGYGRDYKGLSKSQRLDLYLWGVFAGLVPVLMGVYLLPLYWGFGVLVLYLLGCKGDLGNIGRTVKSYNKRKKEGGKKE